LIENNKGANKMTAKKFTKMTMAAIATKAAKDKEDLDVFKTEAAKHVERLLEVAEKAVDECMRKGDEQTELLSELKSIREELGL
jgi:hypothetical protein